MSTSEIPKGLQRAFNLFQVELDECMPRLRESLETFEKDSSLSEENVDRLINTLHRIKGGASFLGLTEIGGTAGSAEAYVKETRLAEAEAGDKLREFLQELEASVGRLEA